MSTLALRQLRTLRQGYPYLLVALAALLGARIGSERHGIGPDYTIDEELTAGRIAQVYTPAIAGLTAFYEQPADAKREQSRSTLAASFKSDETIVAAYVEVHPATGPMTTEFVYSAVNSTGSSCVMRSVEASRSGLVRCHIRTADAGRDVLRLTRPIRKTENLTAIAVLQLDYRGVQKRLRANAGSHRGD
jgi:hypothetical protein